MPLFAADRQSTDHPKPRSRNRKLLHPSPASMADFLQRRMAPSLSFAFIDLLSS
jgi:hypothetical protein